MIENVLILAGGAGTRLWPASCQAHPKQFLEISQGSTLLDLTLDRAAALNPTGYILIVTNESQIDLTREACRGRSEKIAVIPEPEARNTAAALVLGALFLKEKGEKTGRILVLPADHMITPVSAFVHDAEEAAEAAEEGKIVTFGIPPVRPETGYGYIKAGEAFKQGFLIDSFKEKPDAGTAQKYLDEGGYFWNGGMFLWRLDRFFEEMNLHSGDIVEDLADCRLETKPVEGSIEIVEISEKLRLCYASVRKTSIDYALMEKTGSAFVQPVNFTWNDIGSWDEFLDVAEGTGEPVIEVNGGNNRIYSDIPVAVYGVSDLLVVMKNGRLYIGPKEAPQRVKSVVEALKKEGLFQLL